MISPSTIEHERQRDNCSQRLMKDQNHPSPKFNEDHGQLTYSRPKTTQDRTASTLQRASHDEIIYKQLIPASNKRLKKNQTIFFHSELTLHFNETQHNLKANVTEYITRPQVEGSNSKLPSERQQNLHTINNRHLFPRHKNTAEI